MLYNSAYKTWETVQWLFCHYDLFSQIIHLKKAMCKWTSFCFIAASDTLHKDLRTFYFCRQYKLSIEALLCNSQCSCIVNSDLYLSNTQKECIVMLHCHSGYVSAPQCFITHTLPVLLFIDADEASLKFKRMHSKRRVYWIFRKISCHVPKHIRNVRIPSEIQMVFYGIPFERAHPLAPEQVLNI